MIATRQSRSKMALVCLALTAAIWTLCVGTGEAAIVLVDTDSAFTGNTSAPADFSLTDEGTGNRDGIYSYSYNAGASFDMLVVTVSREASSAGQNPAGETFSVSYASVGMTKATGDAAGSGVSIFYLETSATSGTIALDFRNFTTVNGIGIAIAAIKSDNGDPIVLNAANSGTGTSISIDTADGSFTLWAIDTNGGAFNDLPATQIIKDTDIGSNGYGAAYKLETVGQAGKTYSYTNPNKPRGIAAANFKPADTTAPTPPTMTFDVAPHATGESSISMTAATASDPSGVEYYFDETSGNPGGSDSGWQASASYEDTGLDADTEYTYTVQARDQSPAQNSNTASAPASATTDAPDTTPPTPATMTFAVAPYATGNWSISMTATTASDASGVEYYFDCLTAGGHDSGWQASATYEDTGLSIGTEYTYTVQARDQSPAQNSNTASAGAAATTMNDPTPPTLAGSDIVDDAGGVPVSSGATVTYTLTFSEAINVASLENGLSNAAAGGPSITIGTIIENGSEYTVPVTPDAAGSLQLQVASTVTDVAGNPLAAAVTDDDIITVAAGNVYVWTGDISTSMDDADNWLVNGAVPASAPTTANNQTMTPGAGDMLLFDNELGTYDRNPPTLYARQSGTIAFRNGSYNFANSNSGGNKGYSDIDTFVVGDGDSATQASVSSAITRPNRENAGTKTYVVNADGYLEFRNDIDRWSDDANLDTVLRLVGGEARFLGHVGPAAYFTDDAGDYVSFEAEGSEFSADFGGAFANLAAVQANMGASSSFRATPGNTIAARDNGNGTFTIYVDNTLPEIAQADIVADTSGPILEYRDVTYNLTFSEEIDPASVSDGDFTNAGTAPIDIVSVTRLDETDYVVVVTPTGGGNLRLQVGPGVADMAGNNMSGLVEDVETIVVNEDTAAPTATSITDDAGGADVERFQPLTYTVTFDEEISSSTVALTDFTNALDAVITLDSVSPGFDTNILTVIVTPQTGGDIRFRVKAGSVTDLAGNALAADADDGNDITVIADTTPPTLTPSDFVDNVDGGPIQSGTLVTYAVTFSEDMDSDTVDANDFENVAGAGSASITIGAVTETAPNSGVFSVPVTPNTHGTLQIQVKKDAEIRDVAGIGLITSSAIADDTEIVVDDTPPILLSANIADNVGGGPIGSGVIPVTYTLTFNEAIDSASVGAGDFSNAGTSAITKGTPAQTAANVFTMQITPTDAGTLQLEVWTGITDLAGNSLAAPVQDADVIDVEAGATYVWTGAIDDDLSNPTNWLVNGVVPVAAPTSAANQPNTPRIDDRIVFDSTAWTQSPGELYTRNSAMWGSIIVNNGTVSYKDDSQNQGNYSWGGTDTFVVGDGDANTATLNLNVVNWNHGGTTGTKTYVISSDGHLVSNRGGVHTWSNGNDYDTVMRLIGGHVTIDGELNESDLADPGDYVTFEALGSTFTFTKGTAAGRFQTLDDVWAQIGSGLAFRSLDRSILLRPTDNGTTFTITAEEPEPSVFRFR